VKITNEQKDDCEILIESLSILLVMLKDYRKGEDMDSETFTARVHNLIRIFFNVWI
jgi:hypothetical protein